eukprot:GHVU01124711.1.p2 GENE.GHVU01124711.1~~GHVU01124711.1.p2  ORF type:complete len:128 (+),score=11.77 GHVU01124711.1:411-794(+)
MARDGEKLTKCRQELTAEMDRHQITNVRINQIQCDVTKPEDVREAFSKAESLSGPIEGLFNCAGTCVPDTLENLENNETKKMVDLNVLGSIYATKRVSTREQSMEILNRLTICPSYMCAYEGRSYQE